MVGREPEDELSRVVSDRMFVVVVGGGIAGNVADGTNDTMKLLSCDGPGCPEEPEGLCEDASAMDVGHPSSGWDCVVDIRRDVDSRIDDEVDCDTLNPSVALAAWVTKDPFDELEIVAVVAVVVVRLLLLASNCLFHLARSMTGVGGSNE